MEAAINTLVAEFKRYAGKDGSSTLSEAEFRNLVTDELPNYVKNPSDSAAIKELMALQDADKDGELTFTEFCTVIGKVVVTKDSSLS